MLNFIWLGLILIGALVALGRDASDGLANRFRNGQELKAALECPAQETAAVTTSAIKGCTLLLNSDEFERFYSLPAKGGGLIKQRADLIPSGSNQGVLHLSLDDQTPPLWKEIHQAQKNPDFLMARVRWEGPLNRVSQPLFLSFDPVRFIRLNAVTNDGIIRHAAMAVELAIGLIGIMALWLGIMRIAEQAGLIERLARALRGVMTRLFPEVPADHPAMGAMIMNISANMLGLGNAATPLGLKAMEELNKLNQKTGTASDAMCTFLVINTSNVQLIPATVIAIRAASGSSNPTEIIGAVIAATTVSTIVGVITVKLLARLPRFRRQLDRENP
jgi:spore maturation protein A